MGAWRTWGALGSVVCLLAAFGCTGSDGGSGGAGGSGGTGGDGGATPPSCDRTMDWLPRDFDGPELHVDVAGTPPGTGTAADPWTDLQQAIDEAPDGARLLLAPGTYSARASDYTDPSCGNCARDDQHPVPATRGFSITGKALSIVGAGSGETVLSTNAGYGVLVEDACEVQLKNLTVTGGKRDPDGQAADGAVVVRRARLVLDRVEVRDNTELLPENGYPGIAGLMLREGADALVMRSVFENNSWDGVTGFDDGQLRMFGSRVAEGNGVAVGMTWSSRALLVNNDLSTYWKGIGSFVNAHVVARNNTVHHHVGWGVWVTQQGHLDLVNNTVAYNDILGVSLSGEGVTGTFVNNLVAYNGLFRVRAYAADTFGGRFGVRGAAPSESSVFTREYNVLYLNRNNDWVDSDGIPVDAMQGTNDILDPLFPGEEELVLGAGSAAIDAGDPSILDADGSRSDVGATGGPDAGRTGP